MDHAVHERTPRNESFPNCCHHVVIQDCKPLTTPKRLPLRYGVSPMTVDAETIKWGDCLDAVSRTTPQPVVKRFTQSSGTENNIEERNDDGREMTWTDPQLKARYERNLKAMEQRRAAHPELLNKWAVPYKVFTRSSLHGIQNMRINWLMDNHPQQFREMMMANVLEEHLRDIERRTRERQAQIVDRLMESRHLLNRTDCLKAAPQTDLDRLNGMNEAQAESMSMAIHEIVESF